MASIVHDNRHDNISAGELEILRKLKVYASCAALASATARKRPNVSRSLKRLRSLGLVEKRDGLWFLSSAGLDVVDRGCYHGLDTSNAMITPSMTSFSENVRLHDVAVIVYFWHLPAGWEEFRRNRIMQMDVVKDFRWNGSFRGGGLASMILDGYRVACTTKGVKVYLPNVVRNNPEAAWNAVFQMLIDYVLRLERHLRLPSGSLWKDGRMNMKVCSRHFALVKSRFAHWVVDDQRQRRFRVFDEGGQLRLLVDMSQPFQYETETVHPIHAEEDLGNVQPYMQDILEGNCLNPGEVKARIEGFSGELGELKQVNVALAQNIAAHITLVQSVAPAAACVAAAAKDIQASVDGLKAVQKGIFWLMAGAAALIVAWKVFYGI